MCKNLPHPILLGLICSIKKTTGVKAGTLRNNVTGSTVPLTANWKVCQGGGLCVSFSAGRLPARLFTKRFPSLYFSSKQSKAATCARYRRDHRSGPQGPGKTQLPRIHSFILSYDIKTQPPHRVVCWNTQYYEIESFVCCPRARIFFTLPRASTKGGPTRGSRRARWDL